MDESETMENEARGRVAVVGASEGLGRGVALALAEGGWSVLAVARSAETLATLDHSRIDTRVGDATDPVLTNAVMADVDAFVLVAGARPVMGPLADYRWDDFQRPFEVDVKAAFTWLRSALGAERRVHAIVFSSGAALNGSPLSGGYAGAKQTQRFLCRYAQKEARARQLPLTIQCVLPQLNPSTELGRAGIAAYARQTGETPEAFVRKRFGAPLDPAIAGRAIVGMLVGEYRGAEYLLRGDGLTELAS